MSAPTTRVLAALELLQNHRLMGGAELAERLGVDRRTVRRYIAMLEELGVPVTTEQGRYGGYRLVPGYKLPPMMFTDEEAQAIVLGLLAARELGVAQATPAIDSVEAKLERVMPENLKRRAQSLRDTTKFMLPRTDAPQDDRALVTLTRAIEAEQTVGFVYQPPEQKAIERHVDPYGLTFWNGRWYLSGFCHLRQAMRSFRLDRIDKVLPRPSRFQRPPEFNPAEHLMQSLNSFPRNHLVSILLHTDVTTATEAFSFCSDVSGLFQQRPEGLFLETHTDSIDWFGAWLARLPFPFTVVGPPELKQVVRDYAQRLAQACD
ncbi:YafY family protein [Marinimicrobium sp. ABcell2]|uniref:helix-turn-helix transcriptional regulator n=1 Tax=Marinimicrobium sp. ABcell2 TaxID=3069751 RepID=UPI0027B80D3B|nr:YafY family protein [Marinimicrobium sp. ABcell2]MDQ2075751.1 YafY family protein [Marinimicrobium sp. ABcell2]